jgi:hypothetical protein
LEVAVNLSRRLAKLERTEAYRSARSVVRFEGPGSEGSRQPTKEAIETATRVFTVRLVEALEGRPAMLHAHEEFEATKMRG